MWMQIRLNDWLLPIFDATGATVAKAKEDLRQRFHCSLAVSQCQVANTGTRVTCLQDNCPSLCVCHKQRAITQLCRWCCSARSGCQTCRGPVILGVAVEEHNLRHHISGYIVVPIAIQKGPLQQPSCVYALYNPNIL